jgi:AraC-like DNA-binding protein
MDAVKNQNCLARLVRLSNVPGDDGVDARVFDAVRRLRHGERVAEAARFVGLSERQLQRIFGYYMGLSPRTFVRIIRFRCAIKAAKAGASLASAALQSGYADQAHFSRDARSLMGVPPSSLMNHVGNVQDIVAATP